jgi:hypothetical protein
MRASCAPCAVNFQEVVHSIPAVNADVAKHTVIRGGPNGHSQECASDADRSAVVHIGTTPAQPKPARRFLPARLPCAARGAQDAIASSARLDPQRQLLPAQRQRALIHRLRSATRCPRRDAAHCWKVVFQKSPRSLPSIFRETRYPAKCLILLAPPERFTSDPQIRSLLMVKLVWLSLARRHAKVRESGFRPLRTGAHILVTMVANW